MMVRDARFSNILWSDIPPKGLLRGFEAGSGRRLAAIKLNL